MDHQVLTGWLGAAASIGECGKNIENMMKEQLTFRLTLKWKKKNQNTFLSHLLLGQNSY